jgi:hypothetical protein
MSGEKNREFVERLERHPELYERFKGLLQMVENEAGEAL